MRAILRSLSLASALALSTSCGVVQQGAGGGSGGTTGSDATTVALGERAVPGYAITVSERSAIHPGLPADLRVTVVPAADQAPPTSLAAWIGSDYDPEAPAITATPAADAANAFDVSLPVPAAGAATAVWIRLTTADGAVIEAGRDAFPLPAQ